MAAFRLLQKLASTTLVRRRGGFEWPPHFSLQSQRIDNLVGGSQERPQLGANQTLDFRGGDWDRPSVAAARILNRSLGDVVAIPFAILDRMGRRKPVAALVVTETYQQDWHRCPQAVLVGVV